MVEPATPPRLPEALGQSEAFLDFQARLSKVAPVDRPVLIVGERGTGKELAAARLHYLSKRWGGALVALNCSALSPSLIESELFGHERGAFTGAAERRSGRFEAADGGTLFLDELGLVPESVQEKILRVVEYGVFERVGGSSAVQVNVRLVGATNADLPALVNAGKFKADLLDRLSFEVLHIPPLRERIGDISLLARHFAARMSMELERETPELSDAAIETLEAHSWPGNIRELKNVVERAVFHCEGEVIDRIILDPFQTPWRKPVPQTLPPRRTDSANRSDELPADLWEVGLRECVEKLERQALEAALTRANHHQSRASELLRLSYHQFRTLYRKYKGRRKG